MEAHLGTRFSSFVCFLGFCLLQKIPVAENFLKETDVQMICTEGNFCARYVAVPTDGSQGLVAVWAGNGVAVTVLGRVNLKHPGDVTGRLDGLQHRKTSRGTKYCVHSESHPGLKFCDKDVDQVTFTSNIQTMWRFKPKAVALGLMASRPKCKQYYVLSFRMDIGSTPTKLFWQPGKTGRSLNIGLYHANGRYDEYLIAEKASTRNLYDITFQRAFTNTSCVLMSSSLDMSNTCLQDQREANIIYFKSTDNFGLKAPSYSSPFCSPGTLKFSLAVTLKFLKMSFGMKGVSKN
ncbi:uncharacterized protein LOC119570621 [Penaeus monodon]|uniref:uncharacterized protein LOC119570621 n=1 Tax=Penaeus monodon TaxID=6687 RepID=UPI0018A7B958|nr:uncharacterized protein LOC119570621 [Penaeus monodon]